MVALLTVSLVLQITALCLALRLTRPTRRDIGWAFVALALALMAARRGASLFMALNAAEPRQLSINEWVTEWIAFGVSAAMITGLAFLAPFFKSTCKSQDEVVSREARLRALIEAVPDLLFVFRIDGTFLEVVSRNHQTLLSPVDSYAGRNISEYLDPEQAAHYRRSLEAAVRTRKMQVAEYRATRGEVTKIMETRFVALNDQEILVMGRDVTERKEAEDNRVRLESKLQQAQKMESLGVLAGGIAHDFNNLLTGVLGNASLAAMKMPEDSPVQPYVKQIELAAQRAGELTKQLLAYAGKGRFLIQSLSINHLVEEMADLLKTVISKKAVLKLDFSADLPPIRADATQIRQVIMNLITNASDAIGERSGVIRLHTGVMFAERSYLQGAFVEADAAEGYYVFLEVTDTGVGMNDSIQRRIFDPFFTTKFTGRGLGLAAVLGIVRGHQGTIKVYSEPNRGTTFKVLLPAASGVDASTTGTESAPESWRGQGLVLVVDDEDTVRAVAKRVLESAGFEVCMASNGAEAVDAFRDRGSDIRCVLLDLTMPRMGGEEAFRLLRQQRGDVRVVLMSGYNEQEITNQFAGKGLAGFIQKPFRASDLVNVIRKTLEAAK